MYIHLVSYNKLNVFIVIAVVLDTYIRDNKLHPILISYKKNHDNNRLDSRAGPAKKRKMFPKALAPWLLRVRT